MALIETKKKILNSLYLKLHVEDNKVICRAHEAASQLGNLKSYDFGQQRRTALECNFE